MPAIKKTRPQWDKLTLRDVEAWGQVFAQRGIGDAFTFAFPDGSYLGMNATPFHPQYGIGQHGEGLSGEWLGENEKHRVKSQRAWRKLPEGVRQCIHQEIKRLEESIIEAAEKQARDYRDGDDIRVEGPVDPVHDSGNPDDRGATFAWVRGWIRVEMY